MQRYDLMKHYWVLIVITVAAVCISVYQHLPPLITFLFGVGPLVWYHVLLNSSVRTGLSQNTIDSVYYFGFLITITTLAATVIFVSQGGKEVDLMRVVTQFGLGLVATGYALFARMQLMAATERMEDRDPDTIVDEYLKKVKSVVDKIELSASAFEGLADNLAARNEALANQTKTITEATIINAANTFRDKMNEVLNVASDNFAKLGRNLGEINFEDHVSGLKDQFKSLNNTLGVVSTRLGKFENLIATSEDGITKAAVAGSNLAESMQKAVAGVQGVSELGSGIGQLSSGVVTVTEQAIKLTATIKYLEKDLESYVASANQSVKNIEDAINRSSTMSGESVKLLTEHLAQLTRFIIDESQKKIH